MGIRADQFEKTVFGLKSRTDVLHIAFFAALLLLPTLGTTGTEVATSTAKGGEKVVIDTDIGTDIDDAFAVALALRSPELNILGFTTSAGDTEARAKILDRMLGEVGRQDIPVLVGTPTALPHNIAPIGRQTRYGETGRGRFVRASSHPGAAEFIIDQIRRAPGEITLIAIGPLTNVAAVIDKDPKALRDLKRLVIMGGWLKPIDTGTFFTSGPTGPAVEYNVMCDILAAQKVFKSGVKVDVIPFDSTVGLKLDEVKRSALFAQGTRLTDALGILYLMAGIATPTMYDPMTLAYVLDPRLCPIQPMHIQVDNEGLTTIGNGDPNAAACLHSNADAFFDFYMARVARPDSALEERVSSSRKVATF